MGDFFDDGEMLFVAFRWFFAHFRQLELLCLTSGDRFGTELSLMLIPQS